MPRIWIAILGLIFALSAIPPGALAQSNSYKQTNLTSDTAGPAPNVDPNLINPWGIAYFPNNPFWISDNNSGFATLYNASGMNAGSFAVPHSAANPGLSSPTGIVANTTGAGFAVNGKPGLFIFDSEDGAISSWDGSDPVTIEVDNSQMGAVYKGLALITNGGGSFLLAANFNSGAVEVYDNLFHTAHLAGSFTDPNLPSGFAPFGVHLVNNQVLVTYAMQDQAKHDPVHQAGAGYVDLFDLNGNFVQRLISQGNLNAPWGAVIPPSGFGAFGGKLLVGNFGDGSINAFDPAAGAFIDQMKDSTGAPITNASLWDMVFGGGGTSGDPNTLFITAGLANEQHGLFAAITANSTPPATADFSISASPSAATVAAGGSASIMLSVGGLNGFNSAVTFSCSGEPANTSCTFNPNTITPTSGGAVTTSLTIATTTPGSPYHPVVVFPRSGPGPWGYLAIGLFLIAALALRKFAFSGAENFGFGRRRARVFSLLGAAGLIVVAASLLSLGGCGGGSSNSKAANPGTPTGTTTLVVTATSGSISHSTNISLSVQ